jgi:hypothetical protein
VRDQFFRHYNIVVLSVVMPDFQQKLIPFALAILLILVIAAFATHS